MVKYYLFKPPRVPFAMLLIYNVVFIIMFALQLAMIFSEYFVIKIIVSFVVICMAITHIFISNWDYYCCFEKYVKTINGKKIPYEEIKTIVILEYISKKSFSKYSINAEDIERKEVMNGKKRFYYPFIFISRSEICEDNLYINKRKLIPLGTAWRNSLEDIKSKVGTQCTILEKKTSDHSLFGNQTNKNNR